MEGTGVAHCPCTKSSPESLCIIRTSGLLVSTNTPFGDIVFMAEAHNFESKGRSTLNPEYLKFPFTTPIDRCGTCKKASTACWYGL